MRAFGDSPSEDGSHGHHGAGFVGAAQRGRLWCLWHNGSEVRTLLTATVPEIWAELADAVRRPESLVELDDAAFAARVAALRDHGVLPMVLYGLRQGGVWPNLSAVRQDLLAQEEARYKASFVALMGGVERVLALWSPKGFVPVIIKGLHLATQYYPASYLRPMADMDALFPNLREGERAWALAKEAGLEQQGLPLSKDPWVGAHELPMLLDPATGFTLEVQGSLVYGVRDRRWARAATLLEHPVSFEVAGVPVFGLRPEANVVYVLAHNFVQHRASGPKLYPLLDVAMILQREGASLDGELLVSLAEASGFAGPVALGLAWSKALFDAAVPPRVLEGLAALGGDGFRPLAADASGEEEQDSATLDELRNQVSLGEMARLLGSRVFPSGAYMRNRYPDCDRWPLPLLYPLRWSEQAERGLRALMFRLREAQKEEQAKREEKAKKA